MSGGAVYRDTRAESLRGLVEEAQLFMKQRRDEQALILDIGTPLGRSVCAKWWRASWARSMILAATRVNSSSSWRSTAKSLACALLLWRPPRPQQPHPQKKGGGVILYAALKYILVCEALATRRGRG
jgi:hypothetical protein